MGTNAAIAGVVSLLIWLMGVGPFLLVQGPVVVVSATIAVWFFYVQHQFEDTLWAHDGEWSFHEAALNGSSHYELPPALGLVHRQYRGASCAPSFQPHPFLSSAGGPSRSSATRDLRPADVPSELAVRDARGLGRETEAAHIVSRTTHGDAPDSGPRLGDRLLRRGGHMRAAWLRLPFASALGQRDSSI